MRATLLPLVLFTVAVRSSFAGEPKTGVLSSNLKSATALTVAPDGRTYVTTSEPGKGSILVLSGNKLVPFASGLDEPSAITAWQQWLFVTDRAGVWKIDRKGKKEMLTRRANAAPLAAALRDIEVDTESGLVYVSDPGDGKSGGAVYRLGPKGKPVVVTDAKRAPALKSPAGLALDGASFLLALDSGKLHRVRLADGKATKVADGLGSGGRLIWDHYGRLFISDAKGGRVFAIARPGKKAVPLPAKFQSADDIAYEPANGRILVLDRTAGSISALPAQAPGAEVDESPLPFETEVAFPDLKWSGWSGEDEVGKIEPLRPIVLTHAGDGSNRVFVATQHGVIHVFANDPKAAKTQVFLNIRPKVRYSDNENEEGFLGLAFHPKYKDNGEFFVFYTDKKAKLTNVLSRFRVSKDDPNRADPASEEQLLRVERPFWNHDGGTVIFGPDGYLYLALGDGGSANDPFNNAQRLETLLGSVLRIDIDRKDPGKKYAIPKDNPFLGRPKACPEIWAYGLRNVWRMAFDQKTGKLWAADVGQNLFEEINILTAGGNFGWRLRESFHPFGNDGVDVRKDLIEPIWEYHHDVGKSITGGLVYRGKRLPELDGHYLYADYVTGRIWALRYDEDKRRVVANHPIKSRNLPIMSFGEDDEGDAYLMTFTTTGRGIYRFVRSAAAKGDRKSP
jgi:glucose/arabinose dehydrogenase